MQETPHRSSRVFTIGHSNHSIDHFLSLLKMHAVQVVVDTRSYPYSNFSPQFDREIFKRTLAGVGMKYLDLGSQLGGRPEGDEFYDAKGHVYYDKVAATPEFQQGLSRLEQGLEKFAVVILCSEENPAVCHRAILIGKVLAVRGICVEHIRGDGRIQSDSEVSAGSAEDLQPRLFAEPEASTWKSIPSVSRKRRPDNPLGQFLDF